MTAYERVRRGAKTIRHRLGEERGQALVMALAMVVIVLGFGVAVVAGALSSTKLTSHDMRVRRAQQAADAGVQSQIYQQSENNLASAYNFNGGLLGLSSIVDCLPLQVNANLQVTGLAAAQASTAGVCPPAVIPGTPPTSVAPYYTALDNHTYYESEFFSNSQNVSGSGLSYVEFPAVVSIGCDSATASTCGTATSSNVYSRELALLAPTGPIQAVEGSGNVTIVGISIAGLIGLGAVNGDIMAGGNVTMPSTLSLTVNLSGLALSSLFPTIGYGGTVSGNTGTAKTVKLSGGGCTASSYSTFSTKPCYIQRPPPLVTRPTPDNFSTICPACSVAGNITCASCTGGGYNSSNDTFSMSAGTASFKTGDYYFCNFNATGGAINAPTSGTGPVRIFILAPNSLPCSANGYTETSGAWNGGNFVATNGINNIAASLTEGTVSLAANPSAVQIYVEGDGVLNASAPYYDGANKVSIGTTSNSSALTQQLIVYAPTSTVNVDTSSCTSLLAGICTILSSSLGGVFEGSVVGDNVTLDAAVITQDLDIGNYPIESGANAFRVAEELPCNGSLSPPKLAGTSLSADTSGC
jgi:hypothetical protein